MRQIINDHTLSGRGTARRGAKLVRVTFLFTSMEVGGAERIGSELIARLNRRRYQPSVVCLKQLGALGEELCARTVPCTFGLKRNRYDLAVGHRLRETLLSLRPHILCMFGSGGDRSFWGRLAATWSNVPVRICCPHAMGSYEPWEPYNRLLNGLTDAFVAISDRHRAYLIHEARLPAAKVHVIENGVDLRRFRPGPRAGVLGPTDGPARVGVVAVLRPEKDVETWVRAVQELVRRGVEGEFVVVGDGPERVRLKQLAKALGLEGRLRFTGMQQDMPAVYRDLDICVLSSRFEVLPCTLMEAMACGRAVVSTRVGAVEDLVRHGKTGLLVPPREPSALADAVQHLMQDRALRERLASAGRAWVEERFDVERMVRGFEALFEELLRRKLS